MFTDANGNMRGHNHPPNFGRKVDGCGRCGELAAGAAPRVPAVIESRRQESLDEARRREIANHDCVTSNCSFVCTAFDW